MQKIFQIIGLVAFIFLVYALFNQDSVSTTVILLVSGSILFIYLFIYYQEKKKKRQV